MILEIALGIVLAFVILAFWRGILALGMVLVAFAVGTIALGLALYVVYWLAKDQKLPKFDIGAWARENETTFLLLAITFVAVMGVYVIGQLRKERAAAGSPSDTEGSPNSGKEQSSPQGSEQSTKWNLRTALDAAISDEKARIRKTLDENEAKFARSVKMMGPVIAALASLKAEVGEVEGLEILPSQHGHSATVRLKSLGGETSLDISPSFDNTKFEIKEFDFSLDPDYSEKYHSCATSDDVLKFVISAVGKHIASKH